VRDPFSIEALSQGLAGGLNYLRTFTTKITEEQAFDRIFEVLITSRENLRLVSFIAKQQDLKEYVKEKLGKLGNVDPRWKLL